MMKEIQMKLTVSALLLSLGVCSVTALAQTPPQTTQPNPPASGQQPLRGGFGRREMKRRERREGVRALEQLNLTDAQKQQFHTILQSQMQNNKPQREQMRQLKRQARTGRLTAEQQTRARELHQQLMQGRQAVHAQLMNALTAEQKAKLQEFRDLRRANHELMRPRRRLIN